MRRTQVSSARTQVSSARTLVPSIPYKSVRRTGFRKSERLLSSKPVRRTRCISMLLRVPSGVFKVVPNVKTTKA